MGCIVHEDGHYRHLEGTFMWKMNFGTEKMNFGKSGKRSVRTFGQKVMLTNYTKTK